MWICAGNVQDLYRTYREYKDNQLMSRLYPANQDYRDRALVLSDYLDIMAFEIAKQWAEYEPNVNIYEDYTAYKPDFEARILEPCKYLYEHGYVGAHITDITRESDLCDFSAFNK